MASITLLLFSDCKRISTRCAARSAVYGPEYSFRQRWGMALLRKDPCRVGVERRPCASQRGSFCCTISVVRNESLMQKWEFLRLAVHYKHSGVQSIFSKC